jgi:hypothetical protein
LLQAQGEYAVARPYYERALTILENSLGPTHPNTQAVRDNLAALAAAMEKDAGILRRWWRRWRTLAARGQ